MMDLRILDWNLSYIGSIQPKLDLIDRTLGDSSGLMFLQEVRPAEYEALREHFAGRLAFRHSLEHRPPGPFDPPARALGVVVGATPDLPILFSSCLDRSPFPDRTLAVTVRIRGRILPALCLHSITGVDYYRAKSLQFYSFAEASAERRPALVAIDANEPWTDSLDIEKAEYNDNRDKGDGALTFFRTLRDIGLEDAFVLANKGKKALVDADLPFSYVIRRGSKRKRYDHLHVDPTVFAVRRMRYLYEEAVAAGSDHALLVLDARVKG